MYVVGLLPLFLIAIMLGLYLFIRGWVGRRVLSEPICARCRHDLRWRPEAQEKCPGCDADLTRRSAVRFGRKRHAWTPMIGGAVILLVPLFLMLAPVLALRASRPPSPPAIDVAAAPPEILIEEAAAPSLDILSPVWGELTKRYRAGTLPRSAIDAAIAQLLDEAESAGGGRVSMSFDAKEFLEEALSRGDVSDDQLERVVVALFSGRPKLRLPPRIRRTAHVRFDLDPPFVMLPRVEALTSLRAVRLDGGSGGLAVHDERAKPRLPTGRDRGTGRSASGYVRLDVEPGEHELTFEADFGVIRAPAHHGELDTPDPGPAETWPETVHRWSATVTTRVTVLPADLYPAEMVSDPRKAETVRSCFEVRAIRFEPSRRGGWGVRFDYDLARRLPLDVAFRLIMRAEGREIPIGELTIRPDTGRGGFRSGRGGFVDEVPGVDVVEVILRPAPEIVEDEPSGFDQIWGEEIVYEDVPVVRVDEE